MVDIEARKVLQGGACGPVFLVGADEEGERVDGGREDLEQTVRGEFVVVIGSGHTGVPEEIQEHPLGVLLVETPCGPNCCLPAPSEHNRYLLFPE